LNWWDGENFGDALNPLVVGFAARRDVELATRQEAEMFSLRSIMHKILPIFQRPRETRAIIWGTGMRSPLKKDFGMHPDFAALHGPITASLIGVRNVPFVIQACFFQTFQIRQSNAASKLA
jgi:hypothetical protein